MPLWILPKPFNFLCLSLLAFVVLSGCAKRAPLVLRPASKENVLTQASCKARTQIKLWDDVQSISARMDMNFEMQNDEANVFARFYSPFGTQVGELELDEAEAVWRSSEGEIDIQQHDLFSKWYSSNWWSEVAFLMGIVVEKTRKSTQVDEWGRPRALNFSDRHLSCDYSGAKGEKTCKMEGAGFSGSLDFRILECS